MEKEIQKTALRLPVDIHKRIIQEAKKNQRTMNAEIVYRLSKILEEKDDDSSK